MSAAGKHVAVLKGGWSAEREVSLVSGDAVERALAEGGYRVTGIDVTRDLPATLTEVRPDVVFNALHGSIGEDGCVQGLLEVMGLPYSHSGVLASALAMDKPAAKQLFADAGLACPEGRVMRRTEIAAGAAGEPPYVIKPLDQGSSVGVQLVFSGDNAVLPNGDWPFGDQVLVERYIPGREIQVAVMGERALGAIEIRPKGASTTTRPSTPRAMLTTTCRPRSTPTPMPRRWRSHSRPTRHSVAGA